jgi:putative phage-type endonuclease
MTDFDAARKEAWLAERRKCLTGTDIAGILGLSKWSSEYTIWLDKKGRLLATDNDAMRAGRLFERPILEAYSEINDIDLIYADSWTLHLVPDFYLLGASLDARWMYNDNRPVDAKNIRFKTSDWGDNGSDVIPDYYLTQLTVQMMATDSPFAELAVCFSGQDFFRYIVERDLETEAALKDRVKQWWDYHIIKDNMPAPDGSDGCTNYIKDRFKRSQKGIIIESTPEIMEAVEAKKASAEMEKEAQKKKQEAENKIKSYMGDAEEIPGVCTWRNNKDSHVTDWEAAFKSVADSLDDDLITKTLDAHTETKPGARVLKIK